MAKGKHDMRGFVYVLVNNGLPGLVKVGKSTRLPSERVHELSEATEASTPFVVAYEQQFEDCDSVEAYIHTSLEGQGLHPAGNGEFFAASSTDVIQLLLSVPKHVARGNAGGDSSMRADTKSHDTGRHSIPESQPWDDLLALADDYAHGKNGQFQDYAEAFKLYRDAARLGSATAYDRMGHLTEFGMGVRENRAAALELYKESVARGNYLAYASLMGLYSTTRHEPNFHTAFEKYVAEAEAAGEADAASPNGSFVVVLGFYVEWALMRGWCPKLVSAMWANIPRIIQHYQEQAESFGDGRLRDSQVAAMKWLQQQPD